MNLLQSTRCGARHPLAAILSLGSVLFGVFALAPAHAYVLEGDHWPSNQPIVLNLHFGGPGRTLLDGSTSWDQVAEAAMAIWNPYLGNGVQFQSVEVGLAGFAPAQRDGRNSVFYNSTIYGDDFGSDTLAITLSFSNASTQIKTEADVVFNNNKNFDSYRGGLRTDSSGPLYDFRRVALHEFGHVLGLDHTAQNAVSIMTPFTTAIDTIQGDDIAGVAAIYGSVSAVPVISGNLSFGTQVGQDFLYTIRATASPTSYQAGNLPPGLSIDTKTGRITGTPTIEGVYNIPLSATNANGTGTATLTLTVGSAPAITSNLSVTAHVGQPFVYQITASHQPTSFNAFLPTGLSIDRATGIITGTITDAGINRITLTVVNAVGTSTAPLIVTGEFDDAVVTLHTLTTAEGADPSGTPLIQANDGNFYGTTMAGGTSNMGVVFRMTPAGALTNLHSFTGADGKIPVAALLQAADGNFYGSTTQGGGSPASAGTIFKMTPDGTLTTLHSFSYTDGAQPTTSLRQGTDGSLYGVTSSGGGTVFKITPDGTFSVIHTPADGPAYASGLIYATDGNFYLNGRGGGGSSAGLISRMAPDGSLLTLHTFDLFAGSYASAPLVQGSDGNFYGSTAVLLSTGVPAIFRMAPDGTLTTLHTYTAAEGHNASALVQGRDGNFYGTASGGLAGAALAGGTLFKVTPDGTLSVLHVFPFEGGAGPSALVQGSDGEFYGTASMDGTVGGGKVFRTSFLSPPPTAAAPPVVTLAVTTPSVVIGSGGQAEFTMSLSEPQPSNVVVYYAVKGSAVNGTDYVYLKGKQKIKAGKTSKTIAIAPLGDLRGENKRVVKMSLSPSAVYTVGTTTPLKAKILAGQ